MADKTALQESSQALFCAIADFLGLDASNKLLDIKKYNSYIDFKSKNQSAITTASTRVISAGVTLRNIEDFLILNDDWFKSSVLIANALIREISNIDNDFKIKSSGFQNIYYFRGDLEVMGNIQKLFTIANKSVTLIKNQLPFGNINKWNPADIYLASDKAKKEIKETAIKAKPNTFSFSNLNIMTSDLIDSGDLLPLSLKKTTSSVNIQKVNFDRKKEITMLKKISIKGVSDWKPYKPVKFGTKGSTRDIRIILNTGGDIKLRHDPSSKRFVAEFIGGGSEARGGSIGSIKVFCELMRFIDKDTANKVLKAYTEGEKQYLKEIEPVIKMRPLLNKKNPKLFDFQRGEISAITIINKIMPILKPWFSKKDEKVNGFIRMMYEYVTSRTKLSGKFIIAK
tara:strand:+ start:219 stop:1412 length:1194 start_codon:yes stop_codon:yes gene_type:complete